MANFLRSTGVVAFLFALACPASANPPAEITILSFEWRQPFAMWFVPGSAPTVATSPLLVALMSDPRVGSTTDTPAYTSPILREGWMWRGEVRTESGQAGLTR